MYSFLAEGDEFVPPSSKDFVLPPIFGENPYTTKPIFLVFLSVFVLSIFFVMASRKASIVPSKLQFAGESSLGCLPAGPVRSDPHWLEVTGIDPAASPMRTERSTM